MIAEFSHWRPQDLEKPKGILVLTPPSQSDGRGEIRDKHWQDFATKHSLVLVGCHFEDADPTGFEGYCDVRGSRSGERLLDYISKHVNTNTPYERLPILLWGFSAGGQFNYEFAVNYPQLVGGFVVNKGGVYYTALAPIETRNLPGLFIIGEKDSEWRKNIVKGIHGVNQRAGAHNWHLHVEQNSSHQLGNSEEIGREFFEYLMKDWNVEENLKGSQGS